MYAKVLVRRKLVDFQKHENPKNPKNPKNLENLENLENPINN